MSSALDPDPITTLCEASDHVVTAQALCHLLGEDLAALTEVLEQCGGDQPADRTIERQVQAKKNELEWASKELTRARRDEHAAADALAQAEL